MTEAATGLGASPIPTVAPTAGEVPKFRLGQPVSAGAADLAWSVLPQVAMMLLGHSVSDRSGIAALRERVRNHARSIAPRVGPALTRVGPVLMVDTSVQTERVTAPLIEELASRHGEPEHPRLPPLGVNSIRGALQNVRRVEHNLRDAMSIAGVTVPLGLRGELLKVEIVRRRFASARLHLAGVDAILVGTQQNAPTRALLSVARHQQIVSYYLPHAPMADNAFYHDLPTNWALLRGDAEASFYRDLGAMPAERLAVVGSTDEPVSRTTPPASDHVVYAPSPHSPQVLRADINVIRCALEDPIQVSLHPRMRSPDYLQLFPAEWVIVDAPNTSTYLREHGAKAVIQHGSGVGLEALALGLEVIDLCHHGERPNYPYISGPLVQVVHDAHGLREAMDRLPLRSDQRDERIAHARSWCTEPSEDIAKTIVDIIERTSTSTGPGEVLLDGWSRYLGHGK